MKMENGRVDLCVLVCLWTCLSCFLHFWLHLLRAQKMMSDETGRMMAMEPRTLDKLAQGPIDEDIAVITSQPVLLKHCVSRFFLATELLTGTSLDIVLNGGATAP